MLQENKNLWDLSYPLSHLGVFTSPPLKASPYNNIISLSKPSSRRDKGAGVGLVSVSWLICSRDKPLQPSGWEQDAAAQSIISGQQRGIEIKSAADTLLPPLLLHSGSFASPLCGTIQL